MSDSQWKAYEKNSSKKTYPIKQGAIGSDGKFAIYPDEETGTKAALVRIKKKPNQTISELVNVLTPAVENDTDKYIRDLQKWSGIDSDSKISSLTDVQLTALLDAIKRAEGWPPTKNPDLETPEIYERGQNAPDSIKDLFGAGESYDPTDPACTKLEGPGPCTCGRVHPLHLALEFRDEATTCTCWCGQKHRYRGH